MKTSVILSSSDRELFGTIIDQDTKTQMLSVSDLQKSYEVARWQYGWKEKDISIVTKSIDFQERAFYVLESQGIIKQPFGGFIEMVQREGIISVLKGLGAWKTTGARKNKHVMCNPYIWVLIAMEMNPMIYARVVIWLTDSLIFNRIEAGTEYMPMNSAIKSIVENPASFNVASRFYCYGSSVTCF